MISVSWTEPTYHKKFSFEISSNDYRRNEKKNEKNTNSPVVDITNVSYYV